MGAHRICFNGGDSGIHFFPKNLTTFLVVNLKTQLFTITTNAQYTLYYISFPGVGQVPSKHRKSHVVTVTTNAQNTLQHFRGGGQVPLPLPVAPMGRVSACEIS